MLAWAMTRCHVTIRLLMTVDESLRLVQWVDDETVLLPWEKWGSDEVQRVILPSPDSLCAVMQVVLTQQE
jgi:hypothetical protein